MVSFSFHISLSPQFFSYQMSPFPIPILIVFAFHVDFINFYSFQAFLGGSKPSTLGCIVNNFPIIWNLKCSVLQTTMYNKWSLYFEFKMVEKNDHQNIRDFNPTYLSSQGSELWLSRHYSLLVNVAQGLTVTTVVCVYVALYFVWWSCAPARFIIINTKHYCSAWPRLG